MIAPKHEGGWTVCTLREYLLALIRENDRLYIEKFIAAEKAVASALATAERATTKAEDAATKRADSLNESRQMALDNLAVTMPRKEQEQINSAIQLALATHEKKLDQMTGSKGGIKEVWSYIIAGAGIILAALAVLYR